MRDRSRNGAVPDWYRDLTPYRKRSWGRAAGQLINTLIPYLASMVVGIGSIAWGWPVWLTALCLAPAPFFMVRTFILFHDCVHGSFLPSARANRVVGFITGVLTLTPYEPWRVSHLTHHGTTGQLDHRGIGDVNTMTVEEFNAAPLLKRLGYRLYRNPVVLFLFGPIYSFLIKHRFDGIGGSPEERRSVIGADVLIVAIAAVASLAVGAWSYLLVQTAVVVAAGAMGIWLFYVQHQFNPSYWARDDEWDRYAAAMKGSSHYKLPPPLRWLSADIGVHDLHHLQPRIPNYRLRAAYKQVPDEYRSEPLTLRSSLKSIHYHLWNEALGRFVSFRAARALR